MVSLLVVFGGLTGSGVPQMWPHVGQYHMTTNFETAIARTSPAPHLEQGGGVGTLVVG